MKSSGSLLKILFFALFFTWSTHLGCLAAEEVVKTASVSPYPLSTCVVSGEKLGLMGPPFIIQHNGTEVRFCCEGCVKDFNQDPEKYLKQLHAASY
ncbi:MAG: hypothetical protein ACOYK6_07730 [Chthoniobacterales bacterium]